MTTTPPVKIRTVDTERLRAIGDLNRQLQRLRTKRNELRKQTRRLDAEIRAVTKSIRAMEKQAGREAAADSVDEHLLSHAGANTP